MINPMKKIRLKNYFVTSILLCGGPEQDDRVKPRFIDDSWYE